MTLLRVPLLRYLLPLLCLAAGIARDIAAQPAPPRPGVQVLSAEAIAASGAARLSDLLALLDGWFATSIEGYTWSASAGGLAPPGGTDWMVAVDGQPVHLGVLGTQHLNGLPLHLAQLDSVVAVRVPAVVAGRFAPGGVLHLYTRAPERGASVVGDVAAGNETGDPGPFRYTGDPAPNIDRIGPTLFAAARLGTPQGYAALSVKDDEHHATDARIRERVYSLYNQPTNARLILTAPALRLGTDGLLGQHRLLAGRARLDDLRFFVPLGREVPLVHRFRHLALGGTLPPAFGLAYTVAYTASDLDPRPNAEGLAFGWREAHVQGSLESRRRRGHLGVRVDYTRSPAAPTRHVRLLTHLYAGAPFAAGRRWQGEAGVVATHGGDRLGAKALLTSHLRLGRRHALLVHATAARRLFEETEALWYWIAQGYGVPAEAGADTAPAPFYPVGTALTADAALHLHPAARLRLTLSGRYRQFDRQVLADALYGFDPATDGFRVTTRVVPAASGRVLGASGEVQLTAPARLEHRLHYAYTRPFDGDVAFWRAWAPLAWHQASYTVRFVLPRFSLYGRLQYRSPTSWPAFAPAAAATGGRYPDRLPALVLLDVAARKRLWAHRLWGSLALRNALNRQVRLHPAGAVNTLGLYVRLHAHFP